MTQEQPEIKKEPLILWWMPVVALLAPLAWAAWIAASTADNALGEAAFALVWPGVLLYAGAVAVLWAGWKIDLE
ncbi:MAG: hypothetical protein GEU75_00195 [Dehalococcoidia bacterium]|nr:hypothetical protein [Dehalococcoidia bacterium]